jgi:carbonic anhydrase
MAGESGGVGADEALNRLLNGDKRFVAGNSEEPHGAALIERRHALAKDQKPFAVILSCSDSRVSPELVFDVTRGHLCSFAPPEKWWMRSWWAASNMQSNIWEHI